MWCLPSVSRTSVPSQCFDLVLISFDQILFGYPWHIWKQLISYHYFLNTHIHILHNTENLYSFFFCSRSSITGLEQCSLLLLLIYYYYYYLYYYCCCCCCFVRDYQDIILIKVIVCDYNVYCKNLLEEYSTLAFIFPFFFSFTSWTNFTS